MVKKRNGFLLSLFLCLFSSANINAMAYALTQVAAVSQKEYLTFLKRCTDHIRDAQQLPTNAPVNILNLTAENFQQIQRGSHPLVYQITKPIDGVLTTQTYRMNHCPSSCLQPRLQPTTSSNNPSGVHAQIGVTVQRLPQQKNVSHQPSVQNQTRKALNQLWQLFQDYKVQQTPVVVLENASAKTKERMQELQDLLKKNHPNPNTDTVYNAVMSSIDAKGFHLHKINWMIEHYNLKWEAMPAIVDKCSQIAKSELDSRLSQQPPRWMQRDASVRRNIIISDGSTVKEVQKDVVQPNIETSHQIEAAPTDATAITTNTQENLEENQISTQQEIDIQQTHEIQQETTSQPIDNTTLPQSEKKDIWQDVHTDNDLCMDKDVSSDKLFSDELFVDMNITPRTSDVSKKYNLFNFPTDRPLTQDEKDLLRQHVNLLNKLTQPIDHLALNKLISYGLVRVIDGIHGGIEYVGVSLLKLSQDALWRGELAKANWLTRLSVKLGEKLQLALFRGPLKGIAGTGKFLVRATLEPVDSVIKPLGRLAYIMGELWSAADLLETNPDEAFKIYDKLGKDFQPALDATVKYFSTATWDQILEDGIATGVECWLSGKAIGKGVEFAGGTIKKVKQTVGGMPEQPLRTSETTQKFIKQQNQIVDKTVEQLKRKTVQGEKVGESSQKFKAAQTAAGETASMPAQEIKASSQARKTGQQQQQIVDKAQRVEETAKEVGQATFEGQYSGDLVKVPKYDPQAEKLLSQRIKDGQTCMKFSNDPLGKEFDIINKEFIIETKPALRSIGSAFRQQAKRTFEAAKQTGRKVYFHFDGQPSSEIISKLNKYQKKYSIEMIIDTKPLD